MAAARLSEAELIALRDYSALHMLERAVERLRDYSDAERRREREAMFASSEVYGALRIAEGAFANAGADDSVIEFVDLDFTDDAMGWLQQFRAEIRSGLEEGRGTIESNERTADETYLLYVLDGICDRNEP